MRSWRKLEKVGVSANANGNANANAMAMFDSNFQNNTIPNFSRLINNVSLSGSHMNLAVGPRYNTTRHWQSGSCLNQCIRVVRIAGLDDLVPIDLL